MAGGWGCAESWRKCKRYGLAAQVTQLCCGVERPSKGPCCSQALPVRLFPSKCSNTRAATPVVAAVTKAAPAAATATAASLTACRTQLVQATAEIDDIKASLMLQLEDALRQVSQLKADLAAANKATATAQAQADQAVQQRDDAKATSGEHFKTLSTLSTLSTLLARLAAACMAVASYPHGCQRARSGIGQEAGLFWPLRKWLARSWPQPGRRCRSRCHPACLTCLPALPVCPPVHNQAMPINGREACIHWPGPAPGPCAESLRQLVSQLRAEAKEAGEHLSGLQQTLDHTAEEKSATSAELASCRAELSKATGQCGWVACWLVGLCDLAAPQFRPFTSPSRGDWHHSLQQMSRTL